MFDDPYDTLDGKLDTGMIFAHFVGFCLGSLSSLVVSAVLDASIYVLVFEAGLVVSSGVRAFLIYRNATNETKGGD